MTHIGLTPLLLALQAGTAGGSFLPFVVQLVAIFGIFYFLIIRPQAQQKKKHENALSQLKRGDQIVTAGGIIAEVVHIKETPKAEGKSSAMDDQVTIRSAESRLIVERGRIVKIMGSSVSSAPTKE